MRDTVACGDSFAAGFMLGYLRNASIEATTLLSNAVGAGTAMGMTPREQFYRWIYRERV